MNNSTKRECSVCQACGCETALYDVGGKLYCGVHRPVVQSAAPDAQILSTEQQLNLTHRA